MKKIILTSLFAAAVAVQSYGQGEVIIGNSSNTKIWTNGVASTTAGSAGAVMPGSTSQSYTFALLAFDTGTLSSSTNSGTTPTVGDSSTTPYADNNDWELVGYGVNGASGRITDANAFETASGLPVGAYVTMEMIGWNTAVGGSTLTSFETALALAESDGNSIGLMYGYSSEGSILLGNGTVPPNTSAIGTGAGNIAAFTIGEVPVSVTPEPGTMALAGLGGLSLLAFRRKK